MRHLNDQDDHCTLARPDRRSRVPPARSGWSDQDDHYLGIICKNYSWSSYISFFISNKPYNFSDIIPNFYNESTMNTRLSIMLICLYISNLITTDIDYFFSNYILLFNISSTYVYRYIYVASGYGNIIWLSIYYSIYIWKWNLFEIIIYME